MKLRIIAYVLEAADKGREALVKDIGRLKDMVKKTGGDEGKIIKLAERMAKSIKDPDKAERRAKAAELVFVLNKKLSKHLADIFRDAA